MTIYKHKGGIFIKIKFLVIPFIIILLFSGFNFLKFSKWKHETNTFYSKFMNVEFNDIYRPNFSVGYFYTLFDKEKDLICYVKKPDFMDYTGNLGITSFGENKDRLVISPLPDGTYEYAFDFYVESDKSNGYYISKRIYVDRNGNACEKNTNGDIVLTSNETLIHIAKNNKDNLFELFNKAEQVWGIQFT